jgi:hypothetical protein
MVDLMLRAWTQLPPAKTQLVKDIQAVEEYERKMGSTSDEDTKKQLKKDGPEISLHANWLPREGSYFDKQLSFVTKFTKVMWPCIDVSSSGAKAKYRKTVSKLTAFLDLPEVLLSLQRADEINFHKLASSATKNLTLSMLNETKRGDVRRPNDAKRIKLCHMFEEHITKKGLHGAQVSPHEIVREILNSSKISRAHSLALDAQWKDLVRSVVEEVKSKAADDGVDFNPSQMSPMSDVSGSMYGVPMEVSIAMGIIVSEITHPAFQHMVLTFNTNPQ